MGWGWQSGCFTFRYNSPAWSYCNVQKIMREADLGYLLLLFLFFILLTWQFACVSQVHSCPSTSLPWSNIINCPTVSWSTLLHNPDRVCFSFLWGYLALLSSQAFISLCYFNIGDAQTGLGKKGRQTRLKWDNVLSLDLSHSCCNELLLDVFLKQSLVMCLKRRAPNPEKENSHFAYHDWHT